MDMHILMEVKFLEGAGEKKGTGLNWIFTDSAWVDVKGLSYLLLLITFPMLGLDVVDTFWML